MSIIKKIYKGYCRLEVIVACAAFFGIVGMTFMNTMLRYFFSRPITVCDDICLLLFSWAAFMGADIALRGNRLVSMNLVTMNLPVKAQKTLEVLVYCFMLGVLAMFVTKGIALARMNWARYFNTLPISYGWATLSLPVCSIQLIITVLVKMHFTLTHFKDDAVTIQAHNPDEEGKEAQA